MEARLIWRCSVWSLWADKWHEVTRCSSFNHVWNRRGCSRSCTPWRLQTLHHWWDFLRIRTDVQIVPTCKITRQNKISAHPCTWSAVCRRQYFVSRNETGIQSLMDHFAAACGAFLWSSAIKNCCIAPDDLNWYVLYRFILNEKRLEKSLQLLLDSDFCFLGSFYAPWHWSLKKQAQSRIVKVATTFGRLTSKTWRNPHVTSRTTGNIYKARILRIFLYISETRPTYMLPESTLNSFGLRYLRNFCGVMGATRSETKSFCNAPAAKLIMIILKQGACTGLASLPCLWWSFSVQFSMVHCRHVLQVFAWHVVKRNLWQFKVFGLRVENKRPQSSGVLSFATVFWSFTLIFFLKTIIISRTVEVLPNDIFPRKNTALNL